MNSQLIQRIHGVVGGVLLLRATESFVVCVSAIVTPVGGLSSRAMIALPSLVAFTFAAIFGAFYLRGGIQRWMNWLMIVLLGLGAVFSTSATVFSFTMDVKVGGMRGTMLASGVTKLLIAGGLIWCVSMLLRKEKGEPNQTPESTPVTGTPAASAPAASESGTAGL